MTQSLLIVEAANCPEQTTRCCISTLAASAATLHSTFDILVIARGGGHDATCNLTHFGASKVLLLEHEAFDFNVPETFLESVAPIAAKYGLVAAAADRLGLELLPRLAGKLNGTYVTECTGIAEHEGALVFRRSLYAGNIIAWLRVKSGIQLVSVRASHFAAATEISSESPVEIRAVTLPAASPADVIELLELTQVESNGPPLTEARAIVSGGRHFKGKFFQVLQPLADALGASIGATRSACVAGFAPFDCQVGQTGKVVAPQLYLAIGISGSVQHMAGIKGARIIVAINKNPEAPIFRWANYGLVADMFEAVPALVEELVLRNTQSPRAAKAG